MGGDEFFVVAMSSNHVNNLVWPVFGGCATKREVGDRRKAASVGRVGPYQRKKRTDNLERGQPFKPFQCQTQLARALSAANGPCSFVTSFNWKRHHSRKHPKTLLDVASFKTRIGRNWIF
jgi:hypothetical protein